MRETNAPPLQSKMEHLKRPGMESIHDFIVFGCIDQMHIPDAHGKKFGLKNHKVCINRCE